eukprot:439735-Amorphochlora_amoeboformis.AAC.1
MAAATVLVLVGLSWGQSTAAIRSNCAQTPYTSPRLRPLAFSGQFSLRSIKKRLNSARGPKPNWPPAMVSRAFQTGRSCSSLERLAKVWAESTKGDLERLDMMAYGDQP